MGSKFDNLFVVRCTGHVHIQGRVNRGAATSRDRDHRTGGASEQAQHDQWVAADEQGCRRRPHAGRLMQLVCVTHSD